MTLPVLRDRQAPLEGELLPAGTLRRRREGIVPNTVRVCIAMGPVHSVLMEYDNPAGHRVADMLPLDEPTLNVVVAINGVVVPRAYWAKVRTRAGTRITITIVPSGGGGDSKGIFRIVAMLALTVITGGIAGGAMAGMLGAGFAAGSVGAVALSVGVGMVGTLAINAMMPPPKQPAPEFTSTKDIPSISGGSNQLRPYSRKRAVLGTHVVTPDLGARYYTEIVGGEQYLRMHLIVANGPVAIDQIKFENTPAESYNNVEIEIREGWADDAPQTLYPRKVGEEQFGVTLNSYGDSAIRTTEKNTAQSTLEFTAPGGLGRFEKDGSGLNRVRVLFELEMRPTGSGDNAWQRVMDFEPIGPVTAGGVNTADDGYLDGAFTVAAKQAELLRFGVTINHPTPGQWDFRPTRLRSMESTNENNTKAADAERMSAKITWGILRSISADNEPLSVGDVPQATITMRIKASNELGNTVPVVTCRARNYVRVWNGAAWEWKIDSNCAWQYYHAYTHESVNPRPVPDAEMDLDTIVDWADDCRLLGLMFNAEVRAGILLELVQRVAAVGRARRYRNGDKISVVRDLPQNGPVATFAGRNSWDHEINGDLVKRPHALRVKYDDVDNGGQNEVLVYNRGFDETTATEFEVLDVSYGVTDPDQAYKAGRYHFAESILRPETGQFSTDMRNIRCQPGHLIHVQITMALIGQGDARVIQVLGGEDGLVEAVVLDSAVVIEDDRPYEIRFTRDDGSEVVRDIDLAPGKHTRIVLAAAAPGIAQGNHAVFGEADKATIPVLVRDILRERGTDMFATIVWKPSAPEIHDLEDQPLPEGYNTRISAPANLAAIAPERPIVEQVRSDESVLIKALDGSLSPRIVIDYRLVSSLAPSVGRVAVRYRAAGDTYWRTVRDQPTGSIAIDGVRQGERYQLEFAAESIYGAPTGWLALAEETVVGKSTPPPAVANLRAVREEAAVRVEWDDPVVADVADTRVEIYRDGEWQPLGFVDGTQFKLDVLKAAPAYWFRAKHRDTNVVPLESESWAEYELVIDRPPAPVLEYAFDGPDLVLRWTAARGPWPLSAFTVYRDGVALDTPKATQWRTRVNWREPVTFGVTQTDTAGNESDAGTQSIAISPPRLTPQPPQTFVNRALLAWTLTPGSLPVERTRILAGATLATAIERVTSDTNAAFVEETEAGEFSFWLVPQDSAGFDGVGVRQVVSLSAPAGFVLRNQFASVFDGVVTNGYRKAEGALTMPVNATETIAEHFDSNSWAGPGDQIAAGFGFYLQPTPASGEYAEAFDCGAVIPASGVRATVRHRVIAGDADVAVQISVRESEADDWTVYNRGQAQIFASDFRYVRVQLFVDTADGTGLAEIDALDVQVSTQELRETGRSSITANPTRVTLNKSFVDITHVSAEPIGSPANVRVVAVSSYDVANPEYVDFEAYDMTDGSAWTGPFSYSIDGT